jgi:hypothetical protein
MMLRKINLIIVRLEKIQKTDLRTVFTKLYYFLKFQFK